MRHAAANPAPAANEFPNQSLEAQMRYRVGPVHAVKANWGEWDGETRGDTVFDDGSWSEDQPTGILTASGDMIWRCASRIGFDLGFDDDD